MLGKLLKHEWKATARRYGLFYLILTSITLFTAIIHAIPVENFLFSMGENAVMVLYIVSLLAVIFCSTGMAIVRFYKNMVSDEGYLTFTLPAKVGQLVFAKFLVAFVWQLITVILCVVGYVELGKFCDEILNVIDQFGSMIPVFVVMIMLSMMYQLMIFYLSIAIGQRFGTYKILASILAYCVLNYVIEFGIMLVILGIFGAVGFAEMSRSMETLEGIKGVCLLVGGILGTMGIAAYFVTCDQLKKKLNLV